MKSSVKLVILAAALGIAWAGPGTSYAQDALAVITKRQDAMKEQGKSTAAIKAYTEDKADLAAARAAGAQLLASMPTIPSLFPQKTSMADYPGKSYAKPEIWAQWDKFNEGVKSATAAVQTFNALLAAGDKAAITAAFGKLGGEACGVCHTPFRERKT